MVGVQDAGSVFNVNAADAQRQNWRKTFIGWACVANVRLNTWPLSLAIDR